MPLQVQGIERGRERERGVGGERERGRESSKENKAGEGRQS